jgi:hypothetical protein
MVVMMPVVMPDMAGESRRRDQSGNNKRSAE